MSERASELEVSKLGGRGSRNFRQGGGGGSNLPKILTSKNKNEKKDKKGEGGGFQLLFCLCMVEIYFCH